MKMLIKKKFLLGLSGGGHMSFLMAGFCPEYFKAIGTYVPITDLKNCTKQKEHLICIDALFSLQK